MKHQLIGLRDYFSDGKARKRDVYFTDAWHAEDLKDFFQRPAEVLATLPMEEHVNLYFTVAKCGDKRAFISQKYIPFDIDGIDTTRCEEVLRVGTSALGLVFEQCLSLCSGNGVQFYVELPEPITDPEYFRDAKNKTFYRAICERITEALGKAGLQGKADTAVFDAARIMRMPDTWNEKPNKPKVRSYVINASSSPVLFDLKDAAGIPAVEKSEAIIKFPDPDAQAVLDGCENIKLMISDPDAVSEALWYANASIFFHLYARDQNASRKLWHEYSKKYSGYSPGETDRKFDQAGMASGPRTCKNFSSIQGAKCEACKFNGKLKSPILIVGPDHIATKETGFHSVGLDANGNPTMGKPAYGDLLKWFERQHPYVVNAETGSVFIFNGKFYQPYSDTEIRAFAERWFAHCNTQKASEFLQKIRRNNVRDPAWWADSTEGKMNFQNGVLDTSTMEFKDGANRDHGFLFALSYDYSPLATAPRFTQFLEEVTGGDKEIEALLKEFGGYALSNDEYWEHRALLLVGNGRNGKSSYISALKIVAEKGHSSVMLRQLNDSQFTAQLEGKLFNVSEETSLRSFHETDTFKAITAGGDISVKRVYEKPYTIKNRAKMIIALNEIPLTEDTSHGFFQRFAIAPFRVTFTEENMDKQLVSHKFMAERAGILNILLAAYAEMKKRGGVQLAKAGEEELKEYKLDTDPVRSWLDTCIEISESWDENSDFISVSDIFSSYMQFCESSNIKPQNKIVFGRKLALISTLKKRRELRIIGDKTARGYIGLKILEGSF